MSILDLFKPKWKHSDPDKRSEAIEIISDQALLADIAKNDKSSDVRKAAVEKLTDQKILADVAKNNNYYYARKSAVEKLTDQKILADVAKNDESSDVRWVAVEKLTDQKILADVAKNDESSDVPRTVVEKLLSDNKSRNTLIDIFEFNISNEKDDRKYVDFPILKSIDELIESGKTDIAIGKLKQELENNPDCYLFYQRLAEANIKENKLSVARLLLFKALKICKLKTYICDQLAEIEQIEGKYLAATKWWFRTCRLQLESSEIKYPRCFLCIAYIAEAFRFEKITEWFMEKASTAGCGYLAMNAEGKSKMYEIANSIYEAGERDILILSFKELKEM